MNSLKDSENRKKTKNGRPAVKFEEHGFRRRNEDGKPVGVPREKPVNAEEKTERKGGYRGELADKQARIEKLLGKYGRVEPIIGMKNPLHYRNKVHQVFSYSKKTGIISGSYIEGTHKVVNEDDSPLDDEKSLEIIKTIRKLCVSFKITVYNEDTGNGLLRHVLVRRGFKTGEILVVLVLSNKIFPGKNNFIKALLEEHPEITSIVLNVNDKKTSMVLGDYGKPIYGPGFIKDRLCGNIFRISPSSFYQVNPVQCEKLYKTAIDFAKIGKTDTVIDAYCGIGTIGICAAKYAGQVIGVELNGDAVSDAVINARENGLRNIKFVNDDATKWICSYKGNADVVILDPPRTGSTEAFIRAVSKLDPERVIYISCGPDTLARDLGVFDKFGFSVFKIQPVDMFPFTPHVETVVLLSRD